MESSLKLCEGGTISGGFGGLGGLGGFGGFSVMLIGWIG